MEEHEDVDIDPAIAAAMGFSSFGAKPIAKRRKINDESKSGSGANTQPLGQRNQPSKAVSGTRLPEQEIGQAEDHEPKAKQRTKTKQPAPSGLAGFLSRGQDLPMPAVAPVPVAEHPASAETTTKPEGPRTATAEHQKLAEGPQGAFRTAAQEKPSLAAYRHGVRNERGDMVYFLPSFLEDPWAGLRREGG